jgi:hypothetical protein
MVKTVKDLFEKRPNKQEGKENEKGREESNRNFLEGNQCLLFQVK